MYRQLLLTIVVVAVACFVGVPSALAGDTTITTQVFSGGATKASNNDYVLQGTLGLTATRLTTGGGYALENGFWPYIRSLGPCCIGIRGNVDGDPNEAINVNDLAYLIDYLFYSGPAPSCAEEGDVNGSGSINVSDEDYLTSYLYFSGPAPPSCP